VEGVFGVEGLEWRVFFVFEKKKIRDVARGACHEFFSKKEALVGECVSSFFFNRTFAKMNLEGIG
jgi:hypothetical protein